MKIITFNKDVHLKLVSVGYTHLEIRERINDDFIGSGEHKQVQIFKALDRIDTMPAHSRIVPIYSTAITDMLNDEKLNCYVVVQASDNF